MDKQLRQQGRLLCEKISIAVANADCAFTIWEKDNQSWKQWSVYNEDGSLEIWPSSKSLSIRSILSYATTEAIHTAREGMKVL